MLVACRLPCFSSLGLGELPHNAGVQTTVHRASPWQRACRPDRAWSQAAGTYGGVGMGIGSRKGKRPPPPELEWRLK